MTRYKPLTSNQPLSAQPRTVTLRRWGSCISLSLVFLACGGVADLKLGQDTSALEGGTDDDATGTGVAPDGTSTATPVSDTTAVATPDGVFIVDPTTGELYVPCSVGGGASDEPPALEPDTGTAAGGTAAGSAASGTGVAPDGTAAGSAASGTGVAPDGTAAGSAASGTGVAPDGTAAGSAASGTGVAPDGTSTAVAVADTAADGTPVTGQPAPTTTASVSVQPCGPVGYATGGVPAQAPDTAVTPVDGTQPAPVAEEPATAPVPTRRPY